MVRYVRLYLQVVPTFCRTFQQWLQSICLHPCHVFMIIHYFQHEKKNGAVATSSFMPSTNVDSVSFDITITLYCFFSFLKINTISKFLLIWDNYSKKIKSDCLWVINNKLNLSSKLLGIHPMVISSPWADSHLNDYKGTPKFDHQTSPSPLIKHLYLMSKSWWKYRSKTVVFPYDYVHKSMDVRWIYNQCLVTAKKCKGLTQYILVTLFFSFDLVSVTR